MSAVQWLFHYQECVRAEKERRKEQKAIIDLIEVFSLYSHPSVDLQKTASEIEKRKLREKAPEMQRELEADYELAMSVLPKTLSVVEDGADDEYKPVLPLSKREKRGRRKSRLKKKDL